MEKESRISTQAVWRTLSILLLSITLAEGAETIYKVRDFSTANWVTSTLTETSDEIGESRFDSFAIAKLRALRSELQVENLNTGANSDMMAAVLAYLDSFRPSETEDQIARKIQVSGKTVAQTGSENLRMYADHVKTIAEARQTQAALFLATLLVLSGALAVSTKNAKWDEVGKKKRREQSEKKNKRKNKLEADSSIVSVDSDDPTARELATRLASQKSEQQSRQ